MESRSKPGYPGSRSDRIFAAKIGEQNTNQNFYCGTFTTTPAIGSYEDLKSAELTKHPRVKSTPFSVIKSDRIMSDSRYPWTAHEFQHETPAPFAYDTRPSTSKDMIQHKIALSVRKIKTLIEQKKSRQEENLPPSKQLEAELSENIKKLKDLKVLLSALNEDKTLADNRPVSRAKKPAFASSDARDCNRLAKPIERTHYYKGIKNDWTVGSDHRDGVINMNIFKYSDVVNADMLNEAITDTDVLCGVKKPQSRCRGTNFYGDIPNTLIRERLNDSNLKEHTRRLYSPQRRIFSESN